MPSITRYISQKMKDQLKLETVVAQEPFGPGGQIGWHISISHPDRYPTYDEIKKARYDLVPDNVTMAMLFPPSIQFVNVHPNCFHLFQLFEEQVPDLFRAEKRSPKTL